MCSAEPESWNFPTLSWTVHSQGLGIIMALRLDYHTALRLLFAKKYKSSSTGSTSSGPRKHLDMMLLKDSAVFE